MSSSSSTASSDPLNAPFLEGEVPLAAERPRFLATLVPSLLAFRMSRLRECQEPGLVT